MIRSSQKIKMIKISEISPNPYQIRRNFNSFSIKKLASSIKEVGFLSPVTVRTTNRGYELICGQRRLRAAELLGMVSIPAIIVRAGDRQCAQISMIENIHREKLSFFEEAEGYYNLMSYHKVKKDDMEGILSVDKKEIAEKVSFLSIESDVRYQIEKNEMSEKETKEILKLRDGEMQKEIIEKVVKEKMGLREIGEAVKESLREMSQKGEKRGKIRMFNLPLYVNTVRKTADLIKKSGANVELEQKENEKNIEFRIIISK